MAVNQEWMEILAGSQVFKDLPKDALEDIAGVVQPLAVLPKTIIFKEGDSGKSLYIVASGSVRIFRKNSEGIHLDISIKGSGDTFGEMALLTGEPRSADAEAIGETQLLVLSNEHLDRIMRDFPICPKYSPGRCDAGLVSMKNDSRSKSRRPINPYE